MSRAVQRERNSDTSPCLRVESRRVNLACSVRPQPAADMEEQQRP